MKKLHKKHVLIAFGVLIVLCAVFYVLHREVSSRSQAHMTDSISGIVEVQKALTNYYVMHQSYPKTGAACVPVSVITPELSTAGLLSRGDVLQLEGGYPVMVSVTSDALHYVIQSKGSGFESNPITEGDIDGQVLGCDCDDPNYCVGDTKS